MNTEKIIDALAKRARLEKPPEVDVADRVIKILEEKNAPQASADSPLVWIAAVSSAAAAVMICVSYTSFQYLGNPLLGIFIDMPWRML